MAKIYISTALLLYLLYLTIQDTTVSQQQTTCLKYLINMTELGTTNLLELIKIPSPSVNDEYYLKVALNTNNEVKKHNSFGTEDDFQLKLARTLYDTIRAVRQGKPLLYRIYYPSHKPIPTVSAIWFNDEQICLDLDSNGNINATIELGHIVYPPSRNYWMWFRNSSNYRIDNPIQNRLSYSSHSKPTTATPFVEFANNECGITNYYTDSANRLYPNGQEIFPGQWPWVVALFKRSSFLCPGSLLTTTHVITAAHCLKNIIFNETINPNDLIVALGILNLSNQKKGNRINREVANYTIHPDYASRQRDFSADSDLAIVILTMPVEYSPFIKPICLWSTSTKLQNIFNNSGYFVGWSRTCCEVDLSDIDYPRMARVSIVSQETKTSYAVILVAAAAD
ncbi:transmembrane protease serine 11C isoform X2 [Monomorium pharaonis]|uniref:transmembrane protease serine 11C isoform X2 n=1 Tax=Monomorium pharaonis TaxID=307658 RepID=UPI001746B74A|nr:transmembrane protease serine 11C isoform X2 [Monomorium pharaonis]